MGAVGPSRPIMAAGPRADVGCGVEGGPGTGVPAIAAPAALAVAMAAVGSRWAPTGAAARRNASRRGGRSAAILACRATASSAPLLRLGTSDRLPDSCKTRSRGTATRGTVSRRAGFGRAATRAALRIVAGTIRANAMSPRCTAARNGPGGGVITVFNIRETIFSISPCRRPSPARSGRSCLVGRAADDTAPMAGAAGAGRRRTSPVKSKDGNGPADPGPGGTTASSRAWSGLVAATDPTGDGLTGRAGAAARAIGIDRRMMDKAMGTNRFRVMNRRRSRIMVDIDGSGGRSRTKSRGAATGIRRPRAANRSGRARAATALRRCRAARDCGPCLRRPIIAAPDWCQWCWPPSPRQRGSG